MPPLTTLRTPDGLCIYCQRSHSGKCPLIKSISYASDGSVAHVEFHDHQPPTGGDAFARSAAFHSRYPGEEPLRK